MDYVVISKIAATPLNITVDIIAVGIIILAITIYMYYREDKDDE